MKDIIERYVYAVVRRLPDKIKEEVTEELKGHIYDMLPENPTDEEIEKVLIGLGSPRDLAVKYQPKERYIVSPRFFDDYIYTLKIVVIIFVLIAFTFGLIDALVTTTQTNPFYLFFEVLGEIFSSIFESIFSAFAIVTLIFIVIEQVSLKSDKCDWKIKDLPELPKPSKIKISRTGVIFEIIFGTTFAVIFIMILVSYHQYIGVYENGVLLANFFNVSVIKPFLPIFIGLLVFALLVDMLKLVDGRWTKRVIILFSIYTLANLTALIVFITQPNLILNEFFVEMSRILDTTPVKLENGIEKGIRGFMIFIIIMSALDLSTTWYKVLTHKKKSA